MRNKKVHSFFVFLLLLSVIVLVVAVLYEILSVIQFDREYKGHLKRAADANSVELAEKELSIAVGYLTYHGLSTSAGRSQGRIDDYTSVVYSTPDEQISFHYDNILSSLEEVRAVRSKGDNASALERSNVLIKLRESLLDHSGEGEAVTYPSGLAVYPNNTALAMAMILSVLGIVLTSAHLKLED